MLFAALLSCSACFLGGGTSSADLNSKLVHVCQNTALLYVTTRTCQHQCPPMPYVPNTQHACTHNMCTCPHNMRNSCTKMRILKACKHKHITCACMHRLIHAACAQMHDHNACAGCPSYWVWATSPLRWPRCTSASHACAWACCAARAPTSCLSAQRTQGCKYVCVWVSLRVCVYLRACTNLNADMCM